MKSIPWDKREFSPRNLYSAIIACIDMWKRKRKYASQEQYDKISIGTLTCPLCIISSGRGDCKSCPIWLYNKDVMHREGNCAITPHRQVSFYLNEVIFNHKFKPEENSIELKNSIAKEISFLYKVKLFWEEKYNIALYILYPIQKEKLNPYRKG